MEADRDLQARLNWPETTRRGRRSSSRWSEWPRGMASPLAEASMCLSGQL